MILVTGGGGFVGRAIVRRLLDRGEAVRSLARGDYPELRAWGVDARRGDLADATCVSDAVQGCDAVFHVAARAGVWGSHDSYHRPNVLGTQNVLAACREHGVRRLVFTSSPSVVHAGGDIEGADESLPYPDHYDAPYPHTKALAEQAVLAANSPRLSTVALRPHLVWGPHDNHLGPELIARARAGRLRLVGDGRNRVDTTYIDNAADAHLAALDHLRPEAACAGRAYFISNGEPRPIAQIINGIVTAGGAPPVTRHVPLWLAVGAGWLMETAWRALRRPGEPPMTVFTARHLATAHWYDISAARRDLEWEPRVSIDEGLERLRAYLDGEGAG